MFSSELLQADDEAMMMTYELWYELPKPFNQNNASKKFEFFMQGNSLAMSLVFIKILFLKTLAVLFAKQLT